MTEGILPTHRIARREDLAQIVEIYNATIPSRMVTADLEPISVDSRSKWFDEHDPASRPLWVMEHQNRIVAWLSFSSFYGRPAYRHTAELSVYVHASSRKQGLAAYLMTNALMHAPSLKVNTLLGFIFAHNLPSLALFDAFGFQRWGVLPGVALLDGNERDLVIVGKRVPVA